jgi:hypothetical protein
MVEVEQFSSTSLFHTTSPNWDSRDCGWRKIGDLTQPGVPAIPLSGIKVGVARNVEIEGLVEVFLGDRSAASPTVDDQEPSESDRQAVRAVRRLLSSDRWVDVPC